MMTQTKILIVEDEKIVAKDIKTSLEFFDYAFSGIVSTGAEAILRAEETNPDLVLMDIKLRGELDGIEAAGEIRQRFNIPVVYLTSYADEEILERAKITKPFGYILKPIEARELHSTIEIALYRNKMEKRLEESKQWLSTILSSINEAVVATDERGMVSFMNPVAEELVRCRENEALGKELKEIFRITNEEKPDVVQDPIEEVLKEGKEVFKINHSYLKTPIRKRIPIDYSAAPIKNEKDDIIGVVLIFRDITERKQTEYDLKKKISDLEKLCKIAEGRDVKMTELKKRASELEKRVSSLEAKY